MRFDCLLGAICGLLVRNYCWALCSTHNYETILGGYQHIHGTRSITFDIEPLSKDLVVAGKLIGYIVEFGYIYFVIEQYCRVEWVLIASEFS